MNFKHRAIALLAGCTLALGLATGAVADTTSTATVTLKKNPNAQGCTLTSVDNMGGSVTWNGTEYVSAYLSQVNVHFGFDSAFPGETGSCSLSAWGTDFEGQSDDTTTFGIERLQLAGKQISGDSDSPAFIWSGSSGSVGLVSFLNLDGVTVPPDTYTSTLTFTVTTDN